MMNLVLKLRMFCESQLAIVRARKKWTFPYIAFYFTLTKIEYVQFLVQFPRIASKRCLAFIRSKMTLSLVGNMIKLLNGWKREKKERHKHPLSWELSFCHRNNNQSIFRLGIFCGSSQYVAKIILFLGCDVMHSAYIKTKLFGVCFLMYKMAYICVKVCELQWDDCLHHVFPLKYCNPLDMNAYFFSCVCVCLTEYGSYVHLEWQPTSSV